MIITKIKDTREVFTFTNRFNNPSTSDVTGTYRITDDEGLELTFFTFIEDKGEDAFVLEEADLTGLDVMSINEMIVEFMRSVEITNEEGLIILEDLGIGRGNGLITQEDLADLEDRGYGIDEDGNLLEINN